METPPSLIGMDLPAMQTALQAMGVEQRSVRMRSRQLFSWVYNHGTTDFDAMTVFSKTLRDQLSTAFTLDRPRVASMQVSVDGTRKWLLDLADGAQVEMVYIPEAKRDTLCISSQVGCTLSCRFCHTGTQPWVRNLTPGEIVGQVMLARDALGAWPSADIAWNIVFMGMGEPLYNTDNVAMAIDVLCHEEGLAVSKRKITLSTAGVVPQIERVGREMGVNLAISLHATTDAIRDVIVPINRKWNLAQLLETCRAFPGLKNARRITFEYVMLRGINDHPAHAHQLVAMLRGIPAKVNLIPFNPWPGSGYETSTRRSIQEFAAIVQRGGYASPVRRPRGEDILAACGQLKSESTRPKRFVASRAPKASPSAPALHATPQQGITAQHIPPAAQPSPQEQP